MRKGTIVKTIHDLTDRNLFNCNGDVLYVLAGAVGEVVAVDKTIDLIEVAFDSENRWWLLPEEVVAANG